MPDLVIRLKKKTDGAAALSCVRSDGTTTWQRQEGQLGRFFPLHDLTHLAVETVLGFDRAFYGMIASGWDIMFFADPDGRADLPAEALLAELIVGYFDLERATGVVESAEDFNAKIRAYLADRMLPPTALVLTDDQLAGVRALRADLFARWNALPPGDTLTLTFERTGERTVGPVRERTQNHRANVG